MSGVSDDLNPGERSASPFDEPLARSSLGPAGSDVSPAGPAEQEQAQQEQAEQEQAQQEPAPQEPPSAPKTPQTPIGPLELPSSVLVLGAALFAIAGIAVACNLEDLLYRKPDQGRAGVELGFGLGALAGAVLWLAKRPRRLGARRGFLGLAAGLVLLGFAAPFAAILARQPSAPLTQAELTEVGGVIVESLAGDGSELADRWDLRLHYRALGLARAHEASYRAGFKQGLTAQLAAERGLRLYQVLRTVPGPQPRLILRSLGPGDLNYLAFDLARSAAGDPVVLDLTNANVGASISELLADGARTSRAYPQFSAEQRRLQTLLTQGEFDALLAALDSLPAEVRQNRSLMLLRLQAAGCLDTASRDAACREALALPAPQDPLALLSRVPLLQALGRHEDALELLERVAQVVGPDPWLDLLRAPSLSPAEGLAAARRAIQTTPPRQPFPRLVLCRAASRAGELALALEVYQRLAEEDLVAPEVDLQAAPALAPLAESPAYREWLAARPR